MSKLTLILRNEPKKRPTNKLQAQKNCVIVEGSDDAHFFDIFLKERKFSAENTIIFILDGKDNFSKFCSGVMKGAAFSKSGHIKNISIILDADENLSLTLKKVNESLDKYFGVNISHRKFSPWVTGGKIGLFLLPDNNSFGTLETLCLSLINEHSQTTPTIENCLTLTIPQKQRDKRLMQIYLALVDGKHYPGLGAAVREHIIPCNGKSIRDLEKFLLECFAEQ